MIPTVSVPATRMAHQAVTWQEEVAAVTTMAPKT